MSTTTRFPKRWAKPININGFKNKYLITRSGRILNTVTGNEIKSWRDMSAAVEYSRVTLLKNNGKNKKYYLHRLVAEIFIEKPKRKKKLQVNHKDMNTRNNKTTNLEWVTPSENVAHAKLYKAKKRRKQNEKAK
jgi:hypothetical protein